MGQLRRIVFGVQRTPPVALEIPMGGVFLLLVVKQPGGRRAATMSRLAAQKHPRGKRRDIEGYGEEEGKQTTLNPLR